MCTLYSWYARVAIMYIHGMFVEVLFRLHLEYLDMTCCPSAWIDSCTDVWCTRKSVQYDDIWIDDAEQAFSPCCSRQLTGVPF